MKTLKIFVLLIAILLIGCKNNTDSTAAILQVSENQMLNEEGIIGKWKCNTLGYESIITFKEDSGQYSSFIEFEKENMKSKSEVLIKDGNKYKVKDNKSGEYYIVKEDGNLELWDSVGLFTSAVNFAHGSKAPVFSAKKSIGEDVYYIARTFSKSSPETLEGTNNQYWIVYYKDLDVTFKTSKKTDIIQNAKSGKHPNL